MHGDITFGGCHVVWCGDFYQLSPVGQSALYKTNANNANAGVGRTLWLQGITHSVFLSESVRQEGDGKLQELLESVRDGSLEEQLHVLNGRVLSSTCGPEPDMNVTTVTVTDSNSNCYCYCVSQQRPSPSFQSDCDGQHRHGG